MTKIQRKLLDKTRIERLAELHGLITTSAAKTIQAAIEAGGILVEIKAGLPHGEFTPWCAANLPFNTRTAQRYMRCHALRGRLLKNDSVTLLTGAYGLLTEPRPENDVTAELTAMIEELKIALKDARRECDLLEADRWEGEGMPFPIDLEALDRLLGRLEPKHLDQLLEMVKLAGQCQRTYAIITLRRERKCGQVLNEMDEVIKAHPGNFPKGWTAAKFIENPEVGTPIWHAGIVAWVRAEGHEDWAAMLEAEERSA